MDLVLENMGYHGLADKVFERGLGHHLISQSDDGILEKLRAKWALDKAIISQYINEL